MYVLASHVLFTSCSYLTSKQTNVVGLVIVAYISVIDGELGARSTELTIERLLEIKDLSMKVYTQLTVVSIDYS